MTNIYFNENNANTALFKWLVGNIFSLHLKLAGVFVLILPSCSFIFILRLDIKLPITASFYSVLLSEHLFSLGETKTNTEWVK